MARVHEFRHHGQPADLASLSEYLQALHAEPLEGVRRRPRLVGPAPEHGGARGLGRAGGFEQLLARLHRARPGDERHMAAAYAGPAHGDHRIAAAELPAHKLVRPQDGHNLVHPWIGLQRQAGDHLAFPHDRDHGHHIAGRHQAAGPRTLQTLEDALDLLTGRPILHHYHHLSAYPVHFNSPGSEPQRSDRLLRVVVASRANPVTRPTPRGTCRSPPLHLW